MKQFKAFMVRKKNGHIARDRYRKNKIWFYLADAERFAKSIGGTVEELK